jgi:ABC-type antimicrobial peptide transport system permease subunit
MVGENLNNQIGTTMGSFMIWAFLGLTFVVILSAGFNYTNLSVARALKRSREVGIRKVIGAVKGNVLGQFVTEAVIIALLSLVAAVLFFMLFKPYFLELNPDLQKLLRLDLSPGLIVHFVLFALVIGVAAGVFPALYFSRVNAVQVLKGAMGAGVKGHSTIRKALIVFQYSVSLMLITGTLVIYKQYHHFLDYDLGYTTKDILNINLQGNDPDLLVKELNELPEVKGISKSSILTSIGYYWSSNMRNPNNPEDSVTVRMSNIDENYLQLHNHQLLAGRSFNFRPKGALETEVIVNEAVLKRFDMADRIPSKAIGQMVYVDGKHVMIIGVIKDFQYGRSNNQSGEPVVFRYITDKPDYVNVKINTQNMPALNEKMESIWKKIDNVHPYKGGLYVDEIKESMRELDASMKVAGFIAFLAIVIASLGMLGMVVFTTETRVKEVSIRKVMGASEAGLLYLLGRGFFLLLALAALIALPITYMFFDQVLLPQVANHAPIAVEEMTIGLLAVLMIALLMIGTQTIKIARTNPATVLKNE